MIDDAVRLDTPFDAEEPAFSMSFESDDAVRFDMSFDAEEPAFSMNFESGTPSGSPEITVWESIANKPFSYVDSNTLKIENSILKVNTTIDAIHDNTQPITSGGVHTIVGNIDALLRLI